MIGSTQLQEALIAGHYGRSIPTGSTGRSNVIPSERSQLSRRPRARRHGLTDRGALREHLSGGQLFPHRTSRRACCPRPKIIEGNRKLAFAYCILTLGCSRLGRSAEAAQAASRLIGVSRAFASASRKIWFPMLHVFNRTPNCCARQTYLSEAINGDPDR
jgi:hypothetical protein